MLLGVGAPAVREPLGREGVGDGLDDAELDECGGDVRPADRSVPGDPGDLLPLDGHAELLELAHHGAGARHPVVAYEFAFAGQLGLVGVEEVRQHVQAHAVDPAGELGAGDEGEPLGEGGGRLGVTAHGVVVGERDDVQARGGGVRHQLRGGVRAVRGGGVGVQVDAHDAYSSARGGSRGRSRITAVRAAPGRARGPGSGPQPSSRG